MSIDKVLEERGGRYGKFVDHAKIAQSLQDVLHQMPNWPTMDYDMRQALVVITDKIARMGNGDPFYDDNWVDIIGYATLVLNRIRALPENDVELFSIVDDDLPHEKPIVEIVQDGAGHVEGIEVNGDLYTVSDDEPTGVDFKPKINTNYSLPSLEELLNSGKYAEEIRKFFKPLN